jgi:hypothetical protein
VVVSGSECKRFDSGTEGQEKFLWVAWDVGDDVEHRGRKKTCLAGHEVCLPWDSGGVLVGFLAAFVHLGISFRSGGSRFGSGANRGGGGGWLGWSWIPQVGEALGGVQLQEVLQVFWNRNRVHCFPEEGVRVEGDGNGTGVEASNCKGYGIWVDPGAAEVFDVVDGQGSLVNGRGEDNDGVGFVAEVAEAGGSIE